MRRRVRKSRDSLHPPSFCFQLSFFNDTATTEIYTLSLHDALPIFPVAGLTALHGLGKGGLLLGRRVLVTGAPGGVGDFALQLARRAGAHVTASARRADQAPALRQLGAHEVVVGDDIPPSPSYDLVIESVGGRTLGTALAALERGGICVTLGVSASAEVTFDTRTFFVTGRATLYGFYLFTELGSEPASVGLRRLPDPVAPGEPAPPL